MNWGIEDRVLVMTHFWFDTEEWRFWMMLIVRFQAVTLKDIAVNTNWTGATIMCQAALNGGTRALEKHLDPLRNALFPILQAPLILLQPPLMCVIYDNHMLWIRTVNHRSWLETRATGMEKWQTFDVADKEWLLEKGCTQCSKGLGCVK